MHVRADRLSAAANWPHLLRFLIGRKIECNSTNSVHTGLAGRGNVFCGPRQPDTPYVCWPP
jgi:hypothetical protein